MELVITWGGITGLYCCQALLKAAVIPRQRLAAALQSLSFASIPVLWPFDPAGVALCFPAG